MKVFSFFFLFFPVLKGELFYQKVILMLIFSMIFFFWWVKGISGFKLSLSSRCCKFFQLGKVIWCPFIASSSSWIWTMKLWFKVPSSWSTMSSLIFHIHNIPQKNSFSPSFLTFSSFFLSFWITYLILRTDWGGVEPNTSYLLFSWSV